MMEDWNPDPSMVDELWVRAMAQELQRFCKATGEEGMRSRVDSAAVRALSEIKAVLDDPDLEDPECFCRIDAIVDVFYKAGLSTGRHAERE